MSCSNAGSRRGRGCSDQLFTLYGIINDVVYGSRDDVCLQSVDVISCFDRMKYSETHNDIWDVKIQDRNFALIASLDKRCSAKIKTPCGESKTLKLQENIIQGSVFGSIKYSAQVDSLGHDLLSM